VLIYEQISAELFSISAWPVEDGIERQVLACRVTFLN